MTDTLVLKNKLVMPQEGTYLELDQDEMEYVDGGAWWTIPCAIAAECISILLIVDGAMHFLSLGAKIALHIGSVALSALSCGTVFFTKYTFKALGKRYICATFKEIAKIFAPTLKTIGESVLAIGLDCYFR